MGEVAERSQGVGCHLDDLLVLAPTVVDLLERVRSDASKPHVTAPARDVERACSIRERLVELAEVAVSGRPSRPDAATPFVVVQRVDEGFGFAYPLQCVPPF